MRALLFSVLRTRVGVAGVIALLVLAIVGAYRLFGDPAPAATGYAAPPVSPVIPSGPAAEDDGVAHNPGTAQPSVAPGVPGPVEIAVAFAQSWVKGELSGDAWRKALRPRATPRLMDELAGVDPAGVPATRITGEATLVPEAATLAQVDVPLDGGTLRLSLVGPDGHWYVDGIDWIRG